MAKPTKKPVPYDWVKHWDREISAHEKATEEWRSQARTTLAAYSEDHKAALTDEARKMARWAYFWAMEQTRLAMLYGQVPKTNVDRRYADADDDPARVAGEMLERILDEDMQGAHDGMLATLRYALFEFDVLDCGQARVIYEMDEEAQEPVPVQDGEDDGAAAPKAEEELTEVTDERVCVEWVPWDHFHWSAGSKVWSGDHGVRWVAYGCEMPRDALVGKFGAIGKKVPLHSGKKAKEDDEKSADPRSCAYVYEIWSKEHGKVFYYVKGFPMLLRDPAPPPMKLKGFWSCPEPMVQNATTKAFTPRPAYVMCRDLYQELNELAQRARLLEDAVQVSGLYDGTNPSIQQLLKSGRRENKLHPVDNWAMFAEKGGLKGQIDWMPLEMIVNALITLQERAKEVKATLQEINGHSDVLRGEAMGAGVTATDARRATRMASVRLQSAQDRFARFASDLMRLKAEVMCDMFEPERLVERSNVLKTPDGKNPQLVQQAVELLKSGVSDYRIEIRPESVSLQDFSAERSETVEVMKAISDFLAGVAPLAQGMPGSMPTLLKLLRGALSRLRGSRWVEAVLDPAIAQAEQAAQQPQAQQPNPEQLKMQTIQAKAQADMAKEQAKLQADLVKGQADVQNQATIQENQTRANLEEERGKAMIKTQADLQRAAMMPAPAPKGAPK